MLESERIGISCLE
jgi:hypothetical protein